MTLLVLASMISPSSSAHGFTSRDNTLGIFLIKEALLLQDSEEIHKLLCVVGAVREPEPWVLVAVRLKTFLHHRITDVQVGDIGTQRLNHEPGSLIGGGEMGKVHQQAEIVVGGVHIRRQTWPHKEPAR